MMATGAALTTVNLGINLATVLIPEVVELVGAIRSLFTKYPDLKPAQLQELVAQLAAQIHAKNADTQATLESIDTATPPASL